MKTRLTRYLGAMAGITIGTIYTRVNHHLSPLDWSTFTAILGSTLTLFLIHCLWIWYKSDNPANHSN
jgi:hypothetical protein